MLTLVVLVEIISNSLFNTRVSSGLYSKPLNDLDLSLCNKLFTFNVEHLQIIQKGLMQDLIFQIFIFKYSNSLQFFLYVRKMKMVISALNLKIFMIVACSITLLLVLLFLLRE